MSKILVDTNILVYGIDEDSSFFKRARKILGQDEYQLVTTSKNLIEFLAVTTKSSGYNLNNDTVLEIVEEIIQGIDIIYPKQESIAIFPDLMNRYQPKGLKFTILKLLVSVWRMAYMRWLHLIRKISNPLKRYHSWRYSHGD